MRRFYLHSAAWMSILGSTVALGASATSTGGSSERPAPRAIELVAGSGDLTALPNLLVEQPAAFEADARYVLQLDGPITPARRATLEAAGVTLSDYLPPHAYIVALGSASPAALASLDFLTTVTPYQPSWKLDPAIGAREYFTAERQLRAARGEVVVDVTLFEGADVDAALADLAAIDGLTIERNESIAGNPTVTVTLPAQSVADLGEFSAVQFVEEAPDAKQRNDSVRWIVQSNTTDVTPLYDNGLLGEDQVLGHIDGRIDVDHCSFSDTNPIGPTHRKIVAYNTTDGVDDHGTHTAGTAAGDNGVDDDTRGVAYLAKIAHNTIPSFTQTAMFGRLETHHNQGARVHTNSWGDDGTTSYNGMCRGIDDFMHVYEDSLVAFAVTNLSTLKNPENAKNLIAVGGSNDASTQQNWCTGGSGPTSDGRRKPEIYAPGCNIRSANGNTSCSVQGLTGTSMACPGLSGTGLLVRQYFTDGYYPSGAPIAEDAITPTGALIKATLLNSAVDMTGVSGFPSNREGWGRVLADNALYFPGDTRALVVRDVRNADGLSTGEVVEETINVLGNAVPFKVTLAFTDVPGTSGASNPVINDLDLELVSPSNVTYFGNDFTSSQSAANGIRDVENSVEMFLLNTPEVGAWTLRVRGTAVNQETQGYALAITGDVSVGEPEPCVGDFDGNGGRDLGDLGIVLANFGSTNATPEQGDFDGDTDVDLGDLGVMLSVFGLACP